MGALLRSYRSGITRFAATRPGATLLRLTLPGLDRIALRLTSGRRNFTDHVVPTLVLTSTGRVTGRPSQKPLCYLRDGADLIVVGTNWGQTAHPAWTENLLAHAPASVLVNGVESAVTAILVEGADWERFYAGFEAMSPNYRSYRRWTTTRVPRMFRLVGLSP